MIRTPYSKVLALLFILTVISLKGLACEIEFTVGGEKKVYSAGDVVIVELTVVNTHRDCHENIDDAKIMADGCKIAAATPWKEIKPGTYTRKLKVVVLPGNDIEFQIACKRTCDKDGGFGKITLQKKS
ncbi:hypothetical protein [Mangrovibacterium diazotrophicum]|uniref:Uncharacterized protein n=1 Tax=Mangrovibacterium diazotrophicum TaxID=1261403 RepID=A0A419VUY7_9BACT|nr:hypothetical protein [Mangrovibacterium diazotrophicum]RKD85967.1 hypothetical protein BC643_4283 [Mangrovibacterium diazotrophicum]